MSLYALPVTTTTTSGHNPLLLSSLNSHSFLCSIILYIFFPLIFCLLPLNTHVPYVLPPCLLPPSSQHPCALYTSSLSSASFLSTPMCIIYFPLVFCLLPLNAHVPYILPPCLLPPSSQHPCALYTSSLSFASFLSTPMCLIYIPLVFCLLPLNAHVPYILPPCLLPPSSQCPCALGMAGRFALAVSAKKVVLTHFSQRYKVAVTPPKISI